MTSSAATINPRTFGCTVGNRYRAEDMRARSLGLIPPGRVQAYDVFSNAAARMGWGTPSVAESTEYSLARISYDYWLLITLYRNHWISRRIVDTPAKDMVRAWPTITSETDPRDLSLIDHCLRRTNTKAQLLRTLKWARLFGGAGALIVIDGHENKLEEPLKLDDIEPGAYRGLIPFDRWTGITPQDEVCGDTSRPLDFGCPLKYKVSVPNGNSFTVHTSRILRFTGPDVPAPEYQAQMYWGISVLEPVYEEIRKRDNMSWNILSLTFRASIIAMVDDALAQTLAGAGMSQQALRQFQARMEALNQQLSNQNMVVLPKDGGLQQINYPFTGLSDVYQQFQLDIAGAAEIPVSRLYGRTITGLSQSNDADERIYEERIAMDQDQDLRPQLEKLYAVICVSELGEQIDDLKLNFPTVRVLTEEEKSNLAKDSTANVVTLVNAGLMNKPLALKELKQQSTVTGFCTNVTDEDIAAAEEDESLGLGALGEDIPPGKDGGDPRAADAVPVRAAAMTGARF